MRISTRGRYALRAMVDLARHADEGPVLRSDIAARQDISADYIEQLFVKLRKRGLIDSVRGPGGGYVLRQQPNHITAGDIIRAVEGPVAVVHCVETGETGGECPRVATCPTHLLWKQVSDAIDNALDAVTLSDLTGRADILEGVAAGMVDRQ